jgi:hypothetical protein
MNDFDFNNELIRYFDSIRDNSPARGTYDCYDVPCKKCMCSNDGIICRFDDPQIDKKLKAWAEEHR